jgi:hypothetical protein
MMLLTKAIHAKLLDNGRRNIATRLTTEEIDFPPVVKLFTPDAGCAWLLSEIDPTQPDLAFGLCDIGHGTPELGWVSLSEITALRGKIGLPVERDRFFEATHPLSLYAKAARRAGQIIHPPVTEPA